MVQGWSYVKAFATWLWNCGRAWIEIGHRVEALEAKICEQAETHATVDRQLQSDLASAVATAKEGRERLHRRIDELDGAQRERLTELERAQQARIDDWARQLSAQINQVYLAVAATPARNRDA